MQIIMGDVSRKKSQRSESDDEHVLSHKDDSGFVKTFPQRLMELLSVEVESITWMPSGDAFKIINQATFVEQVLPKFFKKTKFTSFKGKLYRWGFRRVMKGENSGAYFHKLFLRDNPTLCLHMRRQMKGNNIEAEIIPEEVKEALNAPSPMTSTSSKTKSQSKKAISKTKAAKAVVSPPQLTETITEMPSLPFVQNSKIQSVQQQQDSSAFASSKQSSRALLNARPSNFMPNNNNTKSLSQVDQITRALVAEGEELMDDGNGHYVGNHCRSIHYDANDAMVSNISNRLTKSEISSSKDFDDFGKYRNTGAYQPSPSLMSLNKQMIENLSNMNPATTPKSGYPFQRSSFQLQGSITEILQSPDFARQRNNQNSLSIQSNNMQQNQHRQEVRFDFVEENDNFSPVVGGRGGARSSNVGAEQQKLDLLSNAALTFRRTPYMHEMRAEVDVNDNMITEKDDVEDSRHPMKNSVVIEPNSRDRNDDFNQFRGHIV